MPTAYTALAARLRRQILSGRFPPATRLPAERELEQRFHVSRITVRQALRILGEEGLISRRHGSGTYVKPNPTRRIPVAIDYTGSMRDHAPRLRRRVQLVEQRPVDADTAATLALPDGTHALYAERVDELHGRAVAWDRAWIAPGFARGIRRRELGHVDFLETWAKRSGFAIDNCEQTVEALPATAQDARYLRLRVGEPLLRSTEIYYARDRQPAGRFISSYHPRYLCVRSRYHWREATR